MFNFRVYLNAFLEDYKAGRFLNDSVANVSRIVPVSGGHYHIIGIHHLTGEENVSKRNLYMEVVDITGKRVNEKIEWGWEGQRPSEHPNPVALDKPLNEPAGNISIDFGQKIWAQVLGKPSDKVYNITTQLPDEGPWNTLGHHSHFVAWIWTEGGIIIPPPPPIPTNDYERGFKEGQESVKHRIIEVLDKL